VKTGYFEAEILTGEFAGEADSNRRVIERARRNTRNHIARSVFFGVNICSRLVQVARRAEVACGQMHFPTCHLSPERQTEAG
jgi:hypothetical protein